ncbi:MAG: tRNA epoxyqueuosine(34) reductase QueG [Phycisphaerales bacterium]
MSPEESARLALDVCQRLGFALAGIADAAPSAFAAQLHDWLAQGKHGSMEYLARGVESRLDPGRVLPGARAAIIVADLYAARGSADADPPPLHGRIARYARGRDYHIALKRRLRTLCDTLRESMPGENFRAFTDTAPVLERELAARAGIGWVGKHSLIIHPGLGSYFFLGGVLTTASLATAPPPAPVADHCGTCTRCIDACPTDAITPYSVDARRCISYLTIERRAPIEPALHDPIGDWLFGCDVCQEVCPHNSAAPHRPAVGEIHPDYATRRDSLDLLAVLGWTADDRSRELSGSAMKRATLAMLKRNALIVLGNQLVRQSSSSVPPTSALQSRCGTDGNAIPSRLREIADDPAEPELVREAARVVLARVHPSPPSA